MIVLDSSAVVAMLEDEPEAERFMAAVIGSERRCICAANVLEAAVVLLRRRGEGGAEAVLDFVAASRTEVLPFDARMILHAVEAYKRYGKGSGSPARLNFGDCIAYSLAKTLDAPLLFKGEDFPATDVQICDA